MKKPAFSVMRTLNLIMNTFPKWIAWLFVALDFIWELPQNLVGLVVKLVYMKYGNRKVNTLNDGVCTIQNWGLYSGVSLGWFQFTYSFSSIETASHEVGHSHQSLYLGPLYLLVIGLPSILWAGVFHARSGKSYYWFYTERWADRCAGIPDR